jgi:hypothetical protein
MREVAGWSGWGCRAWVGVPFGLLHVACVLSASLRHSPKARRCIRVCGAQCSLGLGVGRGLTAVREVPALAGPEQVSRRSGLVGLPRLNHRVQFCSHFIAPLVLFLLPEWKRAFAQRAADMTWSCPAACPCTSGYGSIGGFSLGPGSQRSKCEKVCALPPSGVIATVMTLS